MSDQDAGRLEELRADIDRIDRGFIRLLAERMETVRRIGSLKGSRTGEPLRNDERERALFEFWRAEGEAHGLSDYFLGRILREVLHYSRRDQERFLDADGPAGTSDAVRVGYQGAPGSYSDLALEKLFASRAAGARQHLGYRSFRAVVDALEAGEVGYAFLPVENTIAGSINEVYRLLSEREVFVVDEEQWEVEHCLVGLPGAAAVGLQVVRSHPVALQQCQRFLSGMVGTVSESWYDTAAACASIAEQGDRGVSAIASEEAARRHGLEVLQREIADEPENLTRFLLVSRSPEPVDERIPAKTSLVLTVDHREGALAECLQAFSRRGINLSKLESRPVPGAPWQYLFYVDVEGNADEPGLAATLDEVREHVNELRVLGTYPRRSGISCG